jgi:hypothetical protein
MKRLRRKPPRRQSVHSMSPGATCDGDPGMWIAETIAGFMGEPNCTKDAFLRNPNLALATVVLAEKKALPGIIRRWPKPWSLWKLFGLYDAAFERLAMSRDAEKLLPKLSPETRKNVMLRLWSGCISAAKTIAYKTRSGRNTPETRQRAFRAIDASAESDPFVRAGVAVGPFLKATRKQRVYMDGVPLTSPVWLHMGSALDAAKKATSKR